MEEGATPEEARMTKDEIKELVNKENNLNLKNDEIDKLYDEQLQDEIEDNKMQNEELFLGNNLNGNPMLT